MSREDPLTLRSIYDGFAGGDMWAGASAYDDHVVYISQATDPDPGPHYGLEALTAYMRRFLAEWDDYRIEGTDFREFGDSFVVRNSPLGHREVQSCAG